MPDDHKQNLIIAISEQLERIIRGENSVTIEAGTCDDPALVELVASVNRLIKTFNDMKEFILALAKGNLDVTAPPRNLLSSPFKELQANLRHLTWQTRQIAEGDYSHRVEFMGAFAAAFNTMVEALEEKRRTEELLREAQAKVKHLEGIIPICVYCKKIRDDKESWQQLEEYITEHSDAMFSHGMCPDCFSRVMVDLKKRQKDKDDNQ